jgi:hypothetical protein
MRTKTRWCLAFACLLVASCSKKPAQSAEAQPDPIGDLRREVNELASPRGCKASSECKVAEVGYNPCGGPRVYMVYCGTSTDGARLSAKLGELEKAEKERGSPPDERCVKPKRPTAEAANEICRAK